jgi:hypothetical protein
MVICKLQRDNTLKIKKRALTEDEQAWAEADWYGRFQFPRHQTDVDYETEEELDYGTLLEAGFRLVDPQAGSGRRIF